MWSCQYTECYNRGIHPVDVAKNNHPVRSRSSCSENNDRLKKKNCALKNRTFYLHLPIEPITLSQVVDCSLICYKCGDFFRIGFCIVYLRPDRETELIWPSVKRFKYFFKEQRFFWNQLIMCRNKKINNSFALVARFVLSSSLVNLCILGCHKEWVSLPLGV